MIYKWGHLHVGVQSRGQGCSAMAKAAYNTGSVLKTYEGPTADFTRKSGIKYVNLIAADGSHPDRQKFWYSIEQAEKRKDSAVSRDIESALPIEMTIEQQKSVADNFAKALMEKLNLSGIDYAIHHPRKRKPSANWSMENPHGHYQFPDRDANGNKLKMSRNSRLIKEIRQLWADCVNAEFEKAGMDIRIDLRKVEVQFADMARKEKDLSRQIAQDEAKLKQLLEARDGIRRIQESQGNDSEFHDRRGEEDQGNPGLFGRNRTFEIGNPGDPERHRPENEPHTSRAGQAARSAQHGAKPRHSGNSGEIGLDRRTNEKIDLICDRIQALRFERQSELDIQQRDLDIKAFEICDRIQAQRFQNQKLWSHRHEHGDTETQQSDAGIWQQQNA